MDTSPQQASKWQPLCTTMHTSWVPPSDPARPLPLILLPCPARCLTECRSFPDLRDMLIEDPAHRHCFPPPGSDSEVAKQFCELCQNMALRNSLRCGAAFIHMCSGHCAGHNLFCFLYPFLLFVSCVFFVTSERSERSLRVVHVHAACRLQIDYGTAYDTYAPLDPDRDMAGDDSDEEDDGWLSFLTCSTKGVAVRPARSASIRTTWVALGHMYGGPRCAPAMLAAACKSQKHRPDS